MTGMMFWGITQANEEVPYGTQAEESSMADTIIDFADAKRILDHLMADGLVRPTIVVTPSIP